MQKKHIFFGILLGTIVVSGIFHTSVSAKIWKISFFNNATTQYAQPQWYTKISADTKWYGPKNTSRDTIITAWYSDMTLQELSQINSLADYYCSVSPRARSVEDYSQNSTEQKISSN